MEFLPSDPAGILEWEENVLEVIRNKYDLDKPGRMKEAVEILEAWVDQQSHYVKKDFTRRYLEFTIITCKGSIERAKHRIEKMCTYRTMLPQFFGDFHFIDDFQDIHESLGFVILPKLAPGHCRVMLARVVGEKFYPTLCLQLYRRAIIGGEYLKAHDYVDGFLFIIDFTDTNILTIVKNLNLIDIRHGVMIIMEGLGCRVRGIHLITSSKYIEAFVSICKQVLNPKIANRIYVHNSLESLGNIVAKEILPMDYGGKEKSFSKLQEECCKAFSSKEHREYIKKLNACCTDESLREKNSFNDQTIMGITGTFRTLNVD